ncbi:unnamed protein product [Leptidea sinapis]|uniref:Chitin-binding type-2 domain-containing protein n=1 Tax=Leptidea sinapis TaxID=189913 RepID=A0A5E4PU23_9NEOP|nr:unnamed protein product [Leptidea sinapis]
MMNDPTRVAKISIIMATNKINNMKIVINVNVFVLKEAAQPTKDCPHQFGYFPSSAAAPNDCGQYRMCVGGHALEMLCPTGLAFNPAKASCDWPNNVPSCNVDAFLAFKCPAASYDTDGNPIVTNHRYEGNCFAFYSCGAGQSRLLSCDVGLAFDPALGFCVDEEKVECGIKPVPQQAASTLSGISSSSAPFISSTNAPSKHPV